MKVTGKEYAFFLSALEREASRNWARRLKALAMEADIAPSSLTAIIKGRDNASFDTQVKLAAGCGYAYPEFLVYGRSLVEGGKPEPNPAKIILPQELAAKISALTEQDISFVSSFLDLYIAINAGQDHPQD